MNRSTKMGAGFFVDCVFNRIGNHRSFDDDVEYVGTLRPKPTRSRFMGFAVVKRDYESRQSGRSAAGRPASKRGESLS